MCVIFLSWDEMVLMGTGTDGPADELAVYEDEATLFDWDKGDGEEIDGFVVRTL